MRYDHHQNGNAAEEDRKFVVALARGLEVLRTFRPSDGFLGNNEIAERTGLAKPTVTRITYTLCKLGYLTKVPRLGKYRLAPSAITLGYSALAGLGIRRIARPFMDQLADAVSAPVALGVLDRNAVLYVDISRGSSAFTIQLEIGSRLPLATTAMGRALIAGLPDEQRWEVLSALATLHGENWERLGADVERSVEQFAKVGYVVSMGAWRPDIHAAAVPLVASDGSGIYAFNCGGPPHQFTADFVHGTVAPALVRMVASLEMTLNGEAG
jgi:DNA-binding IclR family transcriptional regulator